ncbi:MAG: hypothetical protein R3B55_01495 [Candidatus Paceibacterota bacterium]
MKTLNKNQKGFVALFTVLLVSVILSMAIGIASISLKEIVLSSSASEGSRAFYAADSGIECALYYDRVNSTEGAFFAGNFMCNGNPPINPLEGADFESPETYSFEIPFGADDELCASIILKRQITGLGYSTLIESKGSNIPCGETSPKKVERSVRVTY